MDLMQEVDFSQGVGQTCYKCQGQIKSRRNLIRSLTHNAWGHRKCSRFSWAYRSKHPGIAGLYAKQMREDLGIA